MSDMNTNPLLERAFLFLEDGNWTAANEYCERVLDMEPKNALAYVGKLMAAFHIRTQDNLKSLSAPFDQNNFFLKAMRFGDEELRATLTGYIDHINARNKELFYD